MPITVADDQHLRIVQAKQQLGRGLCGKLPLTIHTQQQQKTHTNENFERKERVKKGSSFENQNDLVHSSRNTHNTRSSFAMTLSNWTECNSRQWVEAILCIIV